MSINVNSKSEHPEEFALREANKLRYRYPGVGGESYLDVIERVRPIIIGMPHQHFIDSSSVIFLIREIVVVNMCTIYSANGFASRMLDL